MYEIYCTISKFDSGRGNEVPSHTLTILLAFPEEKRDFSTDPVNITFNADEGSAEPERSISIPIVNDGVDEAIEENFIVLLTLVEASNLSGVNVSQPARISSVCHIVDVDGKN